MAHLGADDHVIMTIFSESTSPASDDLIMHIQVYFGTKDHMIVEAVSVTSPAPDDSTMQIRFCLRTVDQIIMTKLSETSPASDEPTM